jgi:C4-dicarboxylate transporter DctM subunit
LNLFVINGIAPDISFKQIVYGVMPFLVIMVLSIVLLCVFPHIVMWLPDQMYGK